MMAAKYVYRAIGVVFATSLFAISGANAQDKPPTKEAQAQFKAAKQKAAEDFRAARAECDKRQGAERRACVKDARESRKQAITKAEKAYGIDRAASLEKERQRTEGAGPR
jgi:hypothetical protein